MYQSRAEVYMGCTPDSLPWSFRTSSIWYVGPSELPDVGIFRLTDLKDKCVILSQNDYADVWLTEEESRCHAWKQLNNLLFKKMDELAGLIPES